MGLFLAAKIPSSASIRRFVSFPSSFNSANQFTLKGRLNVAAVVVVAVVFVVVSFFFNLDLIANWEEEGLLGDKIAASYLKRR